MQQDIICQISHMLEIYYKISARKKVLLKIAGKNWKSKVWEEKAIDFNEHSAKHAKYGSQEVYQSIEENYGKALKTRKFQSSTQYYPYEHSFS